ncbi:MAG: GDP-mannose 4,6-dehydratase [Solirubrobacteraceae bacterium]
MRFLITGGAGFIGSHLCELVLREGHSVHVLDDLSTGSMANIRHLKDNPRFGYTIGSAAAGPLVAELVDEADAVFHLAAAVGVSLVVESPVRTIETNLRCSEVVLKHAGKKRKPVIVASTSEVYGKSAALPFKEDGDLQMGAPNVGRWAYACSKAIDEFLAIAYWKERRLPTVVARLFNTVGPRQTGRYGMVVPRFVRQALDGEPLIVYGNGRQSRCFCHVRDVCEALLGLLLAERSYGEVFNVGGTEEITIEELARLIVELTGSSSQITRTPYNEVFKDGFEDMYRRVPDTTKVQELLGWRPRGSLEEIVMDVVEHSRTAASERQVDAPKRRLSSQRPS